MEGIYDNIEFLPEGWQRVPLGDVITVIRGASPRPKGDPRYFGGDIPWIMISDITREKGKYISQTKDHVTKAGAGKSRHLKAGTLILSNSGTVCVPKILSVDGCIHDGFVAFPDLSENFDILYLYYFFEFIRPRIINAHRQGITQVNLNTGIVKDIKLPVAPREQQKRIIAEIEKQFSRLDEAVANLKRVKANLKRYKAAVLKTAVEGKLTEEWRKQNPDIEPASKLLERILAERRKKWEEAELAKMKAKGKVPKDDKWKKKYKELQEINVNELSSLPRLPSSWAYVRLGNLIEEPKYGTSKKCKYGIDGVGVLRIPNVVNGAVDACDLKFAVFDEKEYQAYELKEGDILTIRSNGSITLVGRCALVTKKDEKLLYAGYLIKLRPFKNIVSSKFLLNCFSSLLLRKQIESKAKSTSGVNNINSGELQSLIVPICSKEEQNLVLDEVESELSIVSGIEDLLDTNLQRVERLRQSILAKAFSGKLLADVYEEIIQ